MTVKTNSDLSSETKKIVCEIEKYNKDGSFDIGCWSESSSKEATEELAKVAAYHFYYIAHLIARSRTHQVTENAIKEVNKALKINENFEEAYFFRAMLKMRIEDYQGAIEDLESALNLNPRSSKYHELAASAYEKNENKQRALIHYDEAVELDPKNFELYRSRGILKANRYDMSGAIKDFTKAIELIQQKKVIDS